MHRGVQQSDDEDDDVTPDSPSSCEDSKKIPRASSKKRRRNMEKRVVSVAVADVEGSKSRGEVQHQHPPSDPWAWRKYGQKPIKGSPYPRGYYRCSSSKGCPARKQVERSRVDPTKLVITYASDHNHPLPSATKPHHTAARKYSHVDTAEPDAAPGLDLSHVDVPMLLGGSYCDPDEFGWFYDVAISDGADVAMEEVEEEESLFSDLGDLPDCAAVFRWRTVAKEEQNRRRDFGFCDFS